MPKQVRFTQLVKSFGQPHPATLWAGDPNDDPDFKKAIEDNRIVTVKNVNIGTKKDAAEIGFVKEGNPTYLIFPKELSVAQGTKVIGLKFDQLGEAPVKDPVKIKEAPRAKKVERVKTIEASEVEPVEEKPAPVKKLSKKAPQKIQASTFTVTLQFKATVQRDVQVHAKTAAEAIAVAMRQAGKLKPKKPDWDTEALEVKLSK